MSIEQRLHCHVVGQGPALVLIHGWGVNAAVWEPVVETLSAHFCLYLVDLPGFGESPPLDDYSLKSISEAILAVLPESAIWCGWSLGGLIATYAAINYPQKITKIIQVSSSIKFVADLKWPGVDVSVFDHFLFGLQSHPQKTLTRFIALQAMGCATARQDSSLFKKLLSGSKAPDHEALLAGLKLLSESDLRPSFARLCQPCLSLFGKFDTLVPLQTSQEMALLAPTLQLQVFEKSSHAPFISESALFCQTIIDFIAD
ncbi:MAG: pimeloyl-ACP methyl ester esterase BioH [Psychromonas sp.]